MDFLVEIFIFLQIFSLTDIKINSIYKEKLSIIKSKEKVAVLVLTKKERDR